MECGADDLKFKIALDILQRVETFKNTPNASEKDFLEGIRESYKDSPEALTYVNSLLEDANLTGISSEEDPVIFEEINKNQLPDFFKTLELSNPLQFILIFGSNDRVLNYILNDFTKEAMNYCVIDTEHLSNLDPLVQSSEQLSRNISLFKQLLAEELIEEFELWDFENETFFDYELGADVKAYDDIMYEAYTQLQSYIDSSGLFKLDSLDLDRDIAVVRKFSKLLQLINFDNLLQLQFSDFVGKGSSKWRNNLLHTKYNLISAYNHDFQRIQVLMNDNRKNAIDYCEPSIKKIISFVPTVLYDLLTGTIKYDSLKLTLDPGTFLSLAPWLKRNIELFKVYFNDPNLNFFSDPVGTVKTILKYLHDSVIDYPTEVSDSDYRKEHWNEIKNFLLLNNTKKEIQTALTVYEYLFNNENRIRPNSRSVHQINTHFYNGIPNFNIVNLFVQQLLQTEAPALQEYNLNGTLLDENSVNSNSAYDTIRNNHILRVGQNSATFEILDAITNTLFTESLTASKLADTLIIDSKKPLKQALETKRYVAALKRLFGVTEVDDNTFKNILNNFCEIHKELNILPIIKEIGQYIKSLKRPQSRRELIAFYLKLSTQANTFSQQLNSDTLGSLFGSILGSYTPIVYTTKDNNQIGILRTTSLIFLMDYCMSNYKTVRPEELGQNESVYKPIRERCNILIDNPQLVHQGENKSYLALTATPLTMGGENYRLERSNLAEYIQDLSNFVGGYISLMLGMKLRDSQSMFGLQLGAFSDKTYNPQLMINAKTKLRGIVPDIRIGRDQISMLLLLGDTGLLHKFTKAYLSSSSLDNVNHEISNWHKLITEIIHFDEKYPDWWSDNTISFCNKIKENCSINEDGSITYISSDGVQGIIKPITVDLFSSEQDSHSTLFKLFLSDPSDDNFNRLLSKSQQLANQLLQSAETLLNIFLIEGMPENFLLEAVPNLGQTYNILFTDRLSYDKYKEAGGYLINQWLLDDLKLNTSQAVLPNSIVYQLDGSLVYGFTTLVTDALLNGSKDFSQIISDNQKQDSLNRALPPNRNQYYYKQVLNSLNTKYWVDGKQITFFNYLVNWFNNPENKTLITNAINMASLGIVTPVLLFDSLYDKDSNGNFLDVNKQKLCEIYYNYLVATDFFRHQILDILGKESYVDKGANIDPEVEKNNRITAGYKRYIIYTASYTPFIQNLVDGVSRKTKIAVIQDTKGKVFNTLGQNAEVDEYDGMGIDSPLEVRLEAKSLCKPHKVSTLKTIIVPVGDYTTQVLKWASNEMTNAHIRESAHTNIDLLSMFRRMHNIDFDYDITRHWDKAYTGSIDTEELLGHPYYTRDNFNIIRYGEILYTGKNDLGINTYSIERFLVNGNDELKIAPWEGPINTIYDIYQAYNGINSCQLTDKGFLYSEDSMDLLFEFMVHAGHQKPGTSTINQDSIEQPLRNAFIGILANLSANKRAAANINTGRVWTEDIPLAWTEIDMTCGGEQLSAEEETDESEITRGSQMIQAAALNGLTTEQATNIYKGLALVMDQNSESFNEYLEVLEKATSSKDVNLLLEYVSEKILKGLDLNGLNEEKLNLVRAFKRRAESTGKFILPLSLLNRDLIKTIAPELNKEVIKQKDSGLMGVLNGSSGFIQTYEFGGKTYTIQDFLTAKNINSFNSFAENINSFLNNNPVTNSGKEITFDDVIYALSVLRLEGTDLTSENVNYHLNKFFGDRLLASVNELITTDKTEAYGYLLIDSQEVKPGQTIVPVLITPATDVNQNSNPIEESTDYEIVEDQPVKVVSNSDILSLQEGGKTLLLDKATPSDLKPAVLTIKTESGQVENEYTSFEALLGERLNRIKSGNPGPNDYAIFTDIVSALITLDPSNDYSGLYQRLQNLELTSEDYKELANIQEDLVNFKNHIKSYGYTLPPYTKASDYFLGFNPRKNFTLLIQKKIVQTDYLTEVTLEDGSIDYQVLNEDVIRNALLFYQKTYATDKKKRAIDRALGRTDGIKLLLLDHPEFLFKHLGYNQYQVIREFLDESGFDKIIESNLDTALIIMPQITRNQVKLGNIDLVDIDLKAFEKQRTHYTLDDNFFDRDTNGNKVANIDFTVRRFNGQYNITVLNDITKVVTDSNGNPVKDSDGNDLLEITLKYGNKVDLTNCIVDGWRINPRTKERIYQVPSGYYEIRSNGHTETIVILNKEGYNPLTDIESLILSDSQRISVQPFASNLLESQDRTKLLALLNKLESMNDMKVFTPMYNRFKSGEDIELIKRDLANDYTSLQSTYDSRFRNISFTSFIRSLDVIATRIPTQNMSSIQTMKIVSYTGNDVNDVFVTKWQQWILGSDFD